MKSRLLTTIGSTLLGAVMGGRAVVAKGPLYKTTKEAKVAAEALGCTKINETVHNGQAVVRKEIHTLPGILMGTTEGPGKWLRQLRI